MTAATDVEAFFAGGAKSAKFAEGAYGSVIGGEITADPVMRQQRDYDTDEPLTYPDGNPMMQMVVTVQAQPPTEDDDGQRAFYIKGQLKQAVGEALRKVNAKSPQKGGKLWVKYLSDEPVTLKTGKRGKDKKIHAAKYEVPAAAQAGQFFAEEAATVTTPAAPPGIDPAQWAAMNPAQRVQLAQALNPQTSVNLAAPPAQFAFTDEPPF